MALCGFVAVVLILSIFGLVRAGRVEAQCSGSGCLPGPGYTFDKFWNCGLIYSNQGCFDAGNCLSFACATVRRIGWASADYDGAGEVPVTVSAICYDCSTAQGHWGAAGINLARACRYTDCRVNTTRSYQTAVAHASGGTARHTIYGHSKG